ncbi:SSI family serine proteinase inhibitor [Streptomyces sp. NPDC058373]|uniref:SSI family serine proteinase inhibitor n=1 Tax=unclassified Streptomyces TaxID=2593676 RepID=UPI00364E4A6C
MRRRLTVSAALAATALCLAAAPARPAPVSEEPDLRGVFLTVAGADGTWSRGVLLECDPVPRGDHARAREACAALDAVDGDLDALPEAPGACPTDYDPVTATAEGTHRGEPVAWERTFTNACVLSRATGTVFAY